MIRILFIALVCVGGLIGMLVYVMSPAKERAEQQERIRKDGGRSLSRGHANKGAIHIPKNRPRTAAHRLITVTAPSTDPLANAGGTTVLVLRGNGVAHRRSALTRLPFQRHTVSSKPIDAAIQQASGFPESGSGYQVTIDLGKGKRTHYASADQITALLDGLSGKVTPWTPNKIRVRLARTDSAASAADWPSLPNFEPDMYTDETGADYGSIDRVMERLMTALQSGSEAFKIDDATWKVVSWSPVFE